MPSNVRRFNSMSAAYGVSSSTLSEPPGRKVVSNGCTREGANVGREIAAAARGPSPGLSTKELEAIRDGLAAGRRPRVVFTESAGQIAGQVGQVIELTDPEVSDEWVVVRLGRDELPFSPADLAIPSRSTSARSASPKTPPPAAVQPELKIVRE